jgi:cell fate regulator YaaT (PSP1 superfamily)
MQLMQTTEYLVKHGRLAAVSRFRNGAGVEFAYGDRVVVRRFQGLEVGEVLSETSDRFAALVNEAPAGDIVRAVTPADEDRERELELFSRQLLDEAQAAADELGLRLAVLDVEIPLDGVSAMLHVLPAAESGDLAQLVQTLAGRRQLSFAILDLRQKPAAEAAGCGKPDCGSGGGGCSSCGSGGGCSTGSCSKGSVKSAEELTAYFSDLRRQMEAQEGRVALLG